jgi:hypothetical protein
MYPPGGQTDGSPVPHRVDPGPGTIFGGGDRMLVITRG